MIKLRDSTRPTCGWILLAVALALGSERPALARAAAPTPPQAFPEEFDWPSVDDDDIAQVQLLVQAGTPVRPFDRASLRVSTTESPADVMAGLCEQLGAAAGDLDGDVWEAWSRSEQISESLALFPIRFGIAPRAAPGWERLAAEARRILDASEGPAPIYALNEGDSHAQLFRALLSDLAGRTLDGQRIRESIVQSHFCGNCADAREDVRTLRRSEAMEVNGNRKLALDLLLTAVTDSYGSQSTFLDQVEDASCARLGLLLLDDGRVADGIAVLQMVLDLRDETPGAEIARAVLVQTGALIEPTVDRIEAIYIRSVGDAFASWRSPRWGLGLIALARFPADRAFERLDETWSHADQQYYRGHAPLEALALLKDERARPIFEAVVSEGDLMIMALALRGLDGLDGGADSYLVPALQRVASSDESAELWDRPDFDAWLREQYGSGPEIPIAGSFKDQEFARRWLDWIDEQRARTPH